jgi:hypothetical protein
MTVTLTTDKGTILLVQTLKLNLRSEVAMLKEDVGWKELNYIFHGWKKKKMSHFRNCG